MGIFVHRLPFCRRVCNPEMPVGSCMSARLFTVKSMLEDALTIVVLRNLRCRFSPSAYFATRSSR